MKLDDVNDALGLQFTSEDYDSLGGLVIELLDRLPEEGEQVATKEGITLLVEKVDKNRIDSIIMTIPTYAEETEQQKENQE